MAKKRTSAPKKEGAKKTRAKRQPRKKRDLDIEIDTPKVDIDIERSNGETKIEIDSEKFDAVIVKNEDEVRVDVKSETRIGKVIGKIATRLIRGRRK